MSTFHELIPVTIASAFIFGMVLALLGSIKLPLAQRLGIDEARVGGLLAALNLALIPMMLLSGLLIDALGVRWVLIGGSIATGLGLFLLARAEAYRMALYSLMLTGAGGSCLSVGAIVLMPTAFFDERHPAAAANLGNAFFGLGALMTPALTEVLTRLVGLRRTLSLLAALCLLPALAGIIAAAGAFPQAPDQPSDLAAVIGNPIVWLAGLVFMLYGPLEGVVGAWATTYLTEFGYSARRALWLLSGFWLVFLAARLLTAFLQQHEVLPEGLEPWFILALALLAAVVMGNLAGTHSRSSAAWGLIWVGAIFGPIFPTLVGIVFSNVDNSKRGSAYGLMYAIGASGSLIVPPMIGAYARRTSVRIALRIPIIVALLLAAAVLILALSVP